MAEPGARLPAFQAEGQRRTLAEQGQYFHQGHFVTDVEDLHGKAQRGFEAGDAVGSPVELLLFFVRGVGRVIGSDGVDGAVEEAFDHGGAIAFGAQGGIHLRIGVVEANAFLSQREMMRCDFAGDVQALVARFADRVESPAGGNVRDVQMAVPHLLQERDVTLYQTRFGLDGHAAQTETKRERACIHGAASGEARIFGVLDNGEPHSCCGAEGPRA